VSRFREAGRPYCVGYSAEPISCRFQFNGLRGVLTWTPTSCSSNRYERLFQAEASLCTLIVRLNALKSKLVAQAYRHYFLGALSCRNTE
jgi:hypothetical protein